MAKIRTADPRAPVRREKLRAFCVKKGWLRPNGDWATGEVATFFGKPTNKMSDLLRGVGSFGSQIARQLEDASSGELAPGELDGLNDDGEFQDVMRIDVKLAGGDGSIAGFEEVIGSLKFATKFLRACHATPSKARVVDVRGHSMHPTIPDGAVVLIDTSKKEPEDDAIFAIARPVEGLSVKRLKLMSASWFATSDNPAGPTIQIDDGEPVTIIGRAVWMGVKL